MSTKSPFFFIEKRKCEIHVKLQIGGGRRGKGREGSRGWRGGRKERRGREIGEGKQQWKQTIVITKVESEASHP